MPQASFLAYATIIVLVAILAIAFIVAVRNRGSSGESGKEKLYWVGIAGLIVALWLGTSSLIAQSGILLEFSRRPPPFVLMAFGFTAATAVFQTWPTAPLFCA